MASVDFNKIKSVSEGKALIRHCDKTMRLAGNHGNKEIDKSKTVHNGQLKGRDYQTTVDVWKKRIDELDRNGNTNQRKDRVELFSLCIPCPDHIDPIQFWKHVSDLCAQKFGKENLIQSYCHLDELHEYKVKGKTYHSLSHVHLFVVPEINGNLNGKQFSSRKNMQMLNKEIDLMCRTQFHVPFLKFDTSEKVSSKYRFTQSANVEDLKRRSKDHALALEINQSTKNMVDTIQDSRTAKEVFQAIKPYVDPALFALEEEAQERRRQRIRREKQDADRLQKEGATDRKNEDR